ncbi:hypothetical protein GCM10020256_53540 [Streptomyces thermocoprophilus]
MLLRRMADHNPQLVADARRTLGVSLTGMREANKRWQAMVRSPRARSAASRYRSVLGPPESEGKRTIGDLECAAWQWPLPLWPDLRFEVLVGPRGAVWNEWLVRAPHAPAPVLRTVEDLTPWSCTVDEAARAFAPRPPPGGHRTHPLGPGVHRARRTRRTARRGRRVHLGPAATHRARPLNGRRADPG